MEIREKQAAKKDVYETYTQQINWDWLFLKGQIIFSVILVFGLAAFTFWFSR